MVAFGAAVDEQRFHRDAGSLWRQDGMPANTPTVTPVCRRHWWLIHTRRHVLVKMRVCLSFRGFCHQRLCLCRLGFFCGLDPDGRQDGTGNGYENLVPLAGEIRSGHPGSPCLHEIQKFRKKCGQRLSGDQSARHEAGKGWRLSGYLFLLSFYDL